ncbi:MULTISPECIES: vitamin B12 ABC transporter ATP-binding protein BtuD [Rahnella]|uniref:vitamin B12 ABC transporter ATP-binding protein BtuD n=1 Tax=Rahnella TaxID=34037 RepID=UPI000EB5D419|nr:MULTISPECIES: vitamin B12 ABC transporter ATP-binding protein BtuD [Rahnella]MBU9863823.1 vitamin B12 ABC transporter ATP-binding protein BtuD [Rahnella aceris]MCM2447297.1 vitamin B12 ABC transporter ATP-binding protein BtuD [Rahnella sp. CG8]RKT89686.1 vitamin B12 transport system ATP-binding protein [Rahnella aquatilis]
MLECREITVAGRLSAFSAQIVPGCRIHIIGPNGAGKSTLLTRLAGMSAGGGEVILDGQRLADVPGPRLARLRAWLCQQLTPASLMPVFQYLSLHQPREVDPAVLERTVSCLCDALHLSDKLGRPVTHLSGGEWQRVRLAAALLQVWPTVNPDSQLLFLDEPMNSLDVAQQQALDQLLAEFCAAGRSVVLSDHDLNHTLHYAHQIWLMSQGQVMAAGKCADVMQPEILSDVYKVAFQIHELAGRQWIMAT